MNAHFYPPQRNANSNETWFTHPKLVVALLTLFLLAYTIIVSLTIDINPAFALLDPQSRALYVDEGFYADAAQNFVKFGQWDMPLDSRHWPGAPFLAFVQTAVFSLFGASLTTARLLSIFFSIVSSLALYSICRNQFSQWISFGIMTTSLLTFNYVGFSRVAIADPLATCLSMLALLLFVRVRTKSIAIPLSLVLAYLAFLSKMYFLFAPVSIFFLWSSEFLILPLVRPNTFNIRNIVFLLCTMSVILLSYYLFRKIFATQISEFLHINGDKTPHLNLTYLLNSFTDASRKLPFHTKSPLYLSIIFFSVIYFLISRLWPATLINIIKDAQKLGRGDWAMGSFVVCGYFVVGALFIHKAHYHYFIILPLGFLSVSALYLLFSGVLRKTLVSFLLVFHIFYQTPYYYEWLSRGQATSLIETAQEIAQLIDTKNQHQLVVPIIGEFSAQLSLFSPKMMSLDARWVSQTDLCERITHWRPKYHVNVVWPKSGSRHMRDKIADCDSIASYKEIKRYPVFKQWQDEIVLTQLNYKQPLL